MLPGTTSKEIDNARLNDLNLKEGNECFYIYPQGLYSGLMLSKQDLKFDKPDNIGEGTYKYEWLITYVAILNKLLVDLRKECTCSKMTALRNGNSDVWYILIKMDLNVVQLTTLHII
jgi:hypothetical protein